MAREGVGESQFQRGDILRKFAVDFNGDDGQSPPVLLISVVNLKKIVNNANGVIRGLRKRIQEKKNRTQKSPDTVSLTSRHTSHIGILSQIW